MRLPLCLVQLLILVLITLVGLDHHVSNHFALNLKILQKTDLAPHLSPC